jgi:hypothetical protein
MKNTFGHTLRGGTRQGDSAQARIVDALEGRMKRLAAHPPD